MKDSQAVSGEGCAGSDVVGRANDVGLTTTVAVFTKKDPPDIVRIRIVSPGTTPFELCRELTLPTAITEVVRTQPSQGELA